MALVGTRVTLVLQDPQDSPGCLDHRVPQARTGSQGRMVCLGGQESKDCAASKEHR